MSKNSKQAETTLLPEQIQYIKNLFDPKYVNYTKDELAKEVGASRTTCWRWHKDEQFKEYLKEQIDCYTNTELKDVWRALVKQAKGGNVKAIKLYMEMKDEYIPPTQKIQQDIKSEGITVQFDIPRPNKD